MSFLISHCDDWTYVSPVNVPEDFYVKCYSVEECVDYNVPYDKREYVVDHWEIDYDLPEQSIRGLLRYTHFKTFEEAAIECNLLGLKCIECKWLSYPPSKTKDGHWYWHMCTIPHFNEVLVPVDAYEQEKERIYRKCLKDSYDEYMEMTRKAKN